MAKTYFNSYLDKNLYKRIKIEAVELNITIKQHISNILKEYVENLITEEEKSLFQNHNTFNKGEVK